MENLYPHLPRRIGRQVQEIIDAKLEGIQLIINEQDITDIQAIIDGPVGTPYEKGKFRIKLILPDNYPEVPPKCHFHTKIFHPNIATESGEVCVDTLKRDWSRDLGLKHILLVIRCLLVEPNPESALNEEAGRLLLEDYSEYVCRASLFTKVHACLHLPRDVLQTRTFSLANQSENAGDTNHVLRDTNADSFKTAVVNPSAQRREVTAKKAMKRL